MFRWLVEPWGSLGGEPRYVSQIRIDVKTAIALELVAVRSPAFGCLSYEVPSISTEHTKTTLHHLSIKCMHAAHDQRPSLFISTNVLVTHTDLSTVIPHPSAHQVLEM
jgi:hypothetical protein